MLKKEELDRVRAISFPDSTFPLTSWFQDETGARVLDQKKCALRFFWPDVRNERVLGTRIGETEMSFKNT